MNSSYNFFSISAHTYKTPWVARSHR
jgi:hypothetical protein